MNTPLIGDLDTKNLTASLKPLYFCLRIPEFAAQALIRLRPTLASAPVAVLEGEAPLEKTCAATLQARRLGVRHGMTRTELESFPNITILRRSPQEEGSAALTLLEMAARFTPRAEELPRTSAHTLALDLTGSTRLLGPPHVIGQKLFRATRELGLFARIASSRNLHTAACLVRAPGNQLITVPPGEERAHLHNLPLTALDLTPDLLDTFVSWGLATLGDLASLAPADLVARLGQQGHRLHQLATGQHDHLLVPAEPTFTLQEHLAFDAPVDNLDSLLFVLAPMLDQLIHRARTRALLLSTLTLTLHLERPADQTDHILDANPDSPPPSPTHPKSVISTERAAAVERPAFRDGPPPGVPTKPGAPSFAPQKVGSEPPRMLHQAKNPGAPSFAPQKVGSEPPRILHQATNPGAPFFAQQRVGSGVPPKPQERTEPSHPRAASETCAEAPQSTSENPRPTHTRTLKPALPLDDRNLLLKLLQLDLQAHPAPAAILAITLHADPGPRPGIQSGLFSPQSPEPLRLEVTLARLAALVGPDSVGRATLTDNHRPQSFRMDRFTVLTEPVKQRQNRNSSKLTTSPLKPLSHPSQNQRTGVALRRLRPAPTVEVTQAEGRPHHLHVQTPSLPAQHYTVARAFGPWRASGYWWSNEVWSHEEWDIDAHAPDGTRLLALLTQNRLHLHWQLQALYD